MTQDQTQKAIQKAAIEAVRAVNEAKTLDTPLAIGSAREKALAKGLQNMALAAGTEIQPTGINSRGEYAVFGKETVPGNPAAPRKEYGPVFAQALSLVPTRCGAEAIQCTVSEGSNWCWVNHFDVERLIRKVASGALLEKKAELDSNGPSL